MKMFFKIILSIVILFILFTVGGLCFLFQGLKAGNMLVVNDVDLTTLADGTYSGKYKAGRWANEVKVEVQNHQIINIEVVKDVVFSKPDVQAELLKQVVENQKVNIDTIAGATVTSKAYLKAIENALQN